MKKRITSLLLTLVMVLSLVPLSAVPAMAADGSDGTAATDPPVIKSKWAYNPDPEWVGVNNRNGDYEGLRSLENLLESSINNHIPLFIQLGSDIKCYNDSGFYRLIEVNGCKHLDLNGHTVFYSVDDHHEDYGDFFITVKEGAELHLYDSKGGGGINFDAQLGSSDIKLQRNLIQVEEGGTLFVNGVKLEAGRSKEIHGRWEEWHGDDSYYGNIRHLVTGNAIYLNSGSQCVINGGEFYGRGVGKAAIYVSAHNVSLVINDGYFKGNSGAEGLRYLNGNSNTNIAYINSASFDTHKNDRLLYMYDSSIVSSDDGSFTYGKYGYAIAASDSGGLVYNPAAKVSESGEGGSKNSRHRITVTLPSAGVGDSFSLEYPGWDTFNPNSEVPRYVYIDADTFTPYFKGQEHHLNQDYNPDTEYYMQVRWQIFDKDGNPVSNELQSTSREGFDDLNKEMSLHLFRDPDDLNSLPDLKYGENYTLRCTLKEAWIGAEEHIFESSAEHKFIVSEIDPSYIQFQLTDVRQVMGKSDFTLEVKGDDWLTDETIKPLENRAYIFGYGSGYDLTPLASILVSNKDQWTTLQDIPEGPQTITGVLTGFDERGVSHAVFDAQGVFVMPRIQYHGLGTADFVEPSDNTITFTPNSQGKYPQISLRAITVDKLQAAGLTAADVRWERFNEYTGKWVVIQGNNVEGVTVETSTGYLMLADSRSGSYRASVEYKGKRWYSPVLTINGRDYSTGQKMTVTVDSPLMEANKDLSANLTYTPDRNSGSFGVRWYPGVLVYEGSVPQSFYDHLAALANKTGYGAERQDDGGIYVRMYNSCITLDPKTCKLTQAPAIANYTAQSVMVPGTYTLIPCARIELSSGNFVPELVKANPITLKVDKRFTGMDISVDGMNATNGTGTSVENAPIYTMNETVNKVRLGYLGTPNDASYLTGTATWTSSDESIATVDANGNLIAWKPGTVTITMNYSAAIDTKRGTEYLNFTRYLKVTVPIAEVKFSAPDWTSYIGQNYSDVQLKDVYARSFNGDWQNGSDYLKNRIYHMSLFEGASTVYPDQTQVKYNDNYYMRFELQPQSGYQFPLKTTYVSSNGKEFVYETNEYTLKSTGMDSSAVDTAFNLGYLPRGEWDTGTMQTPSDCKLTIPYNLKTIRDPNTVYVDLVAVETVEPREGDLRYAGDLPENDEDMQEAVDRYPNTMDVRVLTLIGETTQDGSPLLSGYSRNHKLSTLQGSGTPYTPLDKDELTSDGDAMEFYQTFVDDSWTYDREKLETTRYEAGTYAHELKIYLANQSADGTKYYFSPDVRVLVNGHEVQLIDGYGDPGYKGNSLQLAYYFVSDPRPSLINGTISGLNTPVTGALAQTADDLTVTGRDSAGVTNDKMYVSGLAWFIDANDNGVLDEGERCTPENGFTQDGRFMGGKKYSAFVTLSVEAEDGRINNTAFTLKLDGIDAPLSTSQAQGVYTFPETEIVGYGVSGNVESFNSGTDEVTIQLIESGTTEAAYELILSNGANGTVSGNKITQSFTINDVAPGTYDLVVMKSAHLKYTITGVTVGSEDLDLTQNPNERISLIQMLYGDVTQNGIINLDDINLIQNAANYNKVVSAARDAICDLNGNGTINLDDLNIIQNAANYNKSATNNCTVSYTAP